MSVDDPKKQLRVQVLVHGLMEGVPNSKLPWAVYKLPVGSSKGRGDFTPTKTGDMVWVDFPYKTLGKPDTRRPRIIGSVHFAPNGILNMPSEAYGKPFEHNRSNGEPAAFQGAYHTSKVSTYNHSTIEQVSDGTVRIFSRLSGAITEITPTGRVLVKSTSDMFLTSGGDLNMRASGDWNVDIGGVFNMSASGAKWKKR